MPSEIRVAVIGGARTPFVKVGTVFRKYSALDPGARLQGRSLTLRRGAH